MTLYVKNGCMHSTRLWTYVKQTPALAAAVKIVDVDRVAKPAWLKAVPTLVVGTNWYQGSQARMRLEAVAAQANNAAVATVRQPEFAPPSAAITTNMDASGNMGEGLDDVSAYRGTGTEQTTQDLESALENFQRQRAAMDKAPSSA